MIPRYSLYLDPNETNGYVREDAFGHWLKWVDVMDYVAYAVAHGFVPPAVEVETSPQLRSDMVDDLLPEDHNEIDWGLDELTPDDGVDVYDLITDHTRRNSIEL